MTCPRCNPIKLKFREQRAEIKRLKDEIYVLRMRVSKKVADEIDEDVARCVDQQAKERSTDGE